MRRAERADHCTEKFLNDGAFAVAKRCPASIVERNKRVTLDENHLRIRLTEGHSRSFREATSNPSWGDHVLTDAEVYAWSLANPVLSHDPGMLPPRDKTEFSRTRLTRLLYYE